MNGRLLHWLSQPYPGFVQPWRDLLLVLGVGAAVGLLLLIARPFGLATLPQAQAQVFILAMTAAATGIGILLGVLLPLLWPTPFAEERWNVGRQLLFEVVYLLAIAGVLLLVAVGFGYARLSWPQLALYTGMTALAGLLPLSLRVVLTQVYLLRRNLNELRAAPPTTVPTSGERQVVLSAQTSDSLRLPVDGILFLAAQGNYCLVHWIDNEGAARQHLLRQNIGTLEGQLSDTPIRRCHRSYLVNPARVSGVAGNAQGYRLTVEASAQRVPLSRRYAPTLLPLLRRRAP